MQHSAEMLRCLRELDIEGARRLWAYAQAGMPQPKSFADAEIIVHHARTQMAVLSLRARAYSHAWLVERALPSGLPDKLKPKAERMFPRVAEAVGISVNTKSELFKPIIPHVQSAMEHSVLECYADGEKSPDIIKTRMLDARRTAVRKLLGV